MSANIEEVKQPKTAAEIQDWITDYLVSAIDDLKLADVDPSTPFDRYGLDSMGVVGMSGDLEEWLGITIDPTVPYDYPNIEKMSAHLAEIARG